ncbi:hypothetical protein OO013_06500 [Mangrovivirga sp. M17]|uniref:Lipoprotein n=1 Tax=Mangrovivirga halotolerans TaxID=2993936 RepID=A0ABT3RNY5_9BACT|nr:hypothetical protein [Mangrovivirga halotolerans]MCX2743507.1 hypothetical protein [Mangrovivirga halotolerans]
MWRKELFLLSLVILLVSGCKDNIFKENTGSVSYYLDDKLIESNASDVDITVNPNSKGFMEVYFNAYTFIKEKNQPGYQNLFMFFHTDDLIGKYVYGEDFGVSRMGLCNDENNIACMSSQSCNERQFSLTITSYNKETQTIDGFFEGKVCDNKAEPIYITKGVIKNALVRFE